MINNLLSHFKGLLTMNDFIFGPDSTILILLEEFPEIAEHIAWEAYKKNKTVPMWQYSNSSYILASILIKTYLGTLVPKFLKDNIF